MGTNITVGIIKMEEDSETRSDDVGGDEVYEGVNRRGSNGVSVRKRALYGLYVCELNVGSLITRLVNITSHLFINFKRIMTVNSSD